MTTKNLALVGCGAIAQNFYLPSIKRFREQFGEIWYVDPGDHARSVAASVMPGRQARNLEEVDGEIHLAIIATPNHLHFPLAQQALLRGSDVLIEKPFVIWPEDGRKLIDAASANDRIIAINQTRRFFSVAQALRHRIGKGDFGTIKSIVHREGTKLVWPFESGAGFARNAQRSGAVMDFGVHVLDFYHYLLNPKWTFISAIHDGFEGPEGLADIELRADDAPVSIRLSRYHSQENIARMAFERAEISFSVYDPAVYSVRWASGKRELLPASSKVAQDGSRSDQVLSNFLAASRRQAPAVCDAASSQPVIELLDEMYCHSMRYPAVPGGV